MLGRTASQRWPIAVTPRIRPLAQRLLTAKRDPRPGDLVRLSETDPRHRIGPDAPTFGDIWFPYLPAAGLARVTGTAPGGLEVEFWGRPMRVFREHGQIRPLTLIGRALARERIGLWLMARAIARAAPPDDDPARPGPARRPGWIRRRAARARGGLRIVGALGERWPTWLGFRIWLLLRRLARSIFGYPEDPREGPHGRLMSGCTAILRFDYNGTERMFRLDQVRRHPNDNIHLLGRLLPEGQARSFVLSSIERIDIDGFGAVEPNALWVELHALTETAAAHHRICAAYCADSGLAVPPAPGRMAQTVERLRIWLRRSTRQLREQINIRHLRRRFAAAWRQVRGNLLQALRHPAARRILCAMRARLRLRTAMHDIRPVRARWRRFLHQLADRVEAGDTADPRLLLGLNKLRRDPAFARTLLRGTLQDVRQRLPAGDPRLIWIDEALTLVRDPSRPVTDLDRRDAAFTRQLMREVALPAGPTRWHRIRRSGRDPVLLLVDCALQAIFMPDPHNPAAQRSGSYQLPLRTPFLSALFLFAAEWDGTRWHLPPATARRLRWLADFVQDGSRSVGQS